MNISGTFVIGNICRELSIPRIYEMHELRHSLILMIMSQDRLDYGTFSICSLLMHYFLSKTSIGHIHQLPLIYLLQ